MALYIRKPALIRRSGFTLVELLIAVSVIAIIALAGLTTMTNQTKRARDQKRQADLEQIRTALEMYRLSTTNRLYPTPAQDVPSINLKTDLASFMAVVPQDPRNSSQSKYTYRIKSGSGGKDYELCARLESEPAGASGNCGPSSCGSIGGCNFTCTSAGCKITP